jgi:hypothetical protein
MFPVSIIGKSILFIPQYEEQCLSPRDRPIHWLLTCILIQRKKTSTESMSWAQWLTPIILTTQEGEIGRSWFEASLGK